MIRNFIYEEFHPNHKLDIEHRSRDFMEDWFQRRFNEDSWELSNSFLLNNGTEMTKQEVLQKIHNVFACYSSFRNFQYSINEINFQLNDEDESGFGHSEGSVSYDAITETGEIIPVEGNFKFCLLNEYGWWYITNFEFPGFKW